MTLCGQGLRLRGPFSPLQPELWKFTVDSGQEAELLTEGSGILSIVFYLIPPIAQWIEIIIFYFIGNNIGE